MGIISVEPAEIDNVSNELNNAASIIGKTFKKAESVYNALQMEEWLTNAFSKVLIAEIGDTRKVLSELTNKIKNYAKATREAVSYLESTDIEELKVKVFQPGSKLPGLGILASAGVVFEGNLHTDGNGMAPSIQPSDLKELVEGLKNESVSATNWILKHYDKIPSSIIEDYIKKYPEEGEILSSAIDAVQFTNDVLSGNYDSGTAGALVKMAGGSSTTASVITHTLDVIFDPNSRTSQMYDKMNVLQNQGIEKLIEGDVGEFLKDEAASFGTGLAGIGVGVVDVLTEMTSSSIESIGKKTSGLFQMLSSVIPGDSDIMCTMSDIVDTGTNRVTNFLSNLI